MKIDKNFKFLFCQFFLMVNKTYIGRFHLLVLFSQKKKTWFLFKTSFFFGGVEAEGLQLHQKHRTGFNEYHHRFSSSYLQSKAGILSFFGPSFCEYRQEK